MAAAERALVVGIGGGGDVVGALAFALASEMLGTPCVVGGLTWERRPIDPLPGPRRLDEITGLRGVLHPTVALAGPDTTGPGGFAFAESRMAGVLGTETVLVDPTPGPAAIADGLVTAAGRLECDLVVLLDVGGDVLAHGHEAGLASPLADALLLATSPGLSPVRDSLLVVFGAGCDGELLPTEVAARVDEVAEAGGDLGRLALTDSHAERLEDAIAEVPTEASAMAVRCLRGERGETTIRAGRRRVELTEAGGHLRCLDPLVAMRSAARLAAAVEGAADLHAAHATLEALGIRTELAYEIDAAAESR